RHPPHWTPPWVDPLPMVGPKSPGDSIDVELIPLSGAPLDLRVGGGYRVLEVGRAQNLQMMVLDDYRPGPGGLKSPRSPTRVQVKVRRYVAGQFYAFPVTTTTVSVSAAKAHTGHNSLKFSAAM